MLVHYLGWWLSGEANGPEAKLNKNQKENGVRVLLLKRRKEAQMMKFLGQIVCITCYVMHVDASYLMTCII